MAATPSSTTPQPIVGQPPFATQLRYPNINPLGNGVQGQKGYMIWDDPGTANNNASNLNYTGGVANTGRAIFNFLFNPAQIDFSAQVGDQTAQILAARKYTGSTVVNALPQPQSASWTLYFDRTYELWNGVTNGQTNDPAVIGVQADVLALYQFCGMTSWNSISASATAIASSVPLGMMISPMTMIYSWVYFGTNSGQTATGANTNALTSQLAYYGYVSGFNVNYTAFNRNMTPRQCEIDISFTVISPLAQASVSDSAYGSGILNPNGSGQLGNYGN